MQTDSVDVGVSAVPFTEEERIAMLIRPADESQIRVPSVARTMLQIVLLKTALRVVGFERTWRWIRHSAESAPLVAAVDPASIARVEYTVAIGAALFPGRALCLERSLTLYHYLRRRGVGVEYVMGVQMYPFAAHAWVEYRGQIINDVPEHVRRYRSIEGVRS